MIAGALRRSARAVATRWKLRRCELRGEAEARGTIWIHGAGTITLGDGVRLDGSWAPIELHAGAGAEIVIDDGVQIDGGVSIEAQRSVRIGAGSRVGRFCKILDNHFHRTDARDERPQSTPIVVEQDVDLGVRATLLPGAHLGRAAIVRAGTVVARRIPAGAIAAGMPMSLRRS